MEINCIRRSPRGLVAADLVVPVGGVEVKYGIYLQKDITLKFASTDRGRAELAANFLKLMNVDAEVKRMGGRDVWYVLATTDRIAAGRRELRDAVAEIVRAALARGWVNKEKAERWLRKLERGRALKEGWPKYGLGLARGALEVRYQTTNASNVEREVERLRAMGLTEGKHFSAKTPEGGKRGYVSILKGGLGVRRPAFSPRRGRAAETGGRVHQLHTPEGEGGGRGGIQKGPCGGEERRAVGSLETLPFFLSSFPRGQPRGGWPPPAARRRRGSAERTQPPGGGPPLRGGGPTPSFSLLLSGGIHEKPDRGLAPCQTFLVHSL